MKITLPEQVKQIIKTLQGSGHEAYAVGGCVRDCILDKQPADWDITTSASPEQMKALFRRTIDTGIKHGTVTVLWEGMSCEVTTYRVDGEYLDGRHPEEVTFVKELSEDLRRRDFTINAMAYNDETGLVDLFGGIRDLTDGIIRCVGEPKERFSEDALRMMRAVRFAAQLSFTIDPKTEEAIKSLSPTLQRVSAERIRTELMKTLVSPHPEYLRLFYETGLTKVFLPEFDVMMATPQNTVHHCYSVGEHTLKVMEQVPAKPVLRLSALLHDVAKPNCRTTDETGADHFYGHPEMGVELTGEILHRLKFDNETIRRVKQLVRWHDERPAATARSVRRAAAKMGEAVFPEIFALKRADALSQSDYHRAEKLSSIDAFERLYEEILQKKEALSVKELAVNGKDLIHAGVLAGPEVGRILDCLLAEVLEEPEKNNRETLLDMVAEILQKQGA